MHFCIINSKKMVSVKNVYTTISAIFITLAAFGQTGSPTNPYYQEKGIAIKGYDPVSYFTVQKAIAGDPAITFSWKGAQWQFSSIENLELFKKQPEKYAPQFGGYCAYGVSENHKSPTDPNAWTVVGEKLYLNYNLKVKELWSKDIPGRIQKADSNWISLEKEAH
jgi:YHS domain-containing protein